MDFICNMKKLLFLMCLVGVSAHAQSFLVFGTSIERGAIATSIDSSWVGRLRKAVYPQQVVNMSVSGSTYMDSIQTSMWPALYLARQQNVSPSYIILGGAFNDSKFNPQLRFQREYGRFLDSVQKFWPHAELICNTPIKCRNYPQYAAKLESVIVPVTIEQAYVAGARVCNLYQLPSFVAGPDGVHPNDAGYGVMFRAFWRWFNGIPEKKKDLIIEAPVVEMRVGNRFVRKAIRQGFQLE